MEIFGVIGWKNSGKTHLVERLVSNITSRGISVSTIKHAHHSFDFSTTDEQGRDLRFEGAHEVVFTSAARWSIVRERPDDEEDLLQDMVARLDPVDLVIVEGYKMESHPKIEAFRGENKKALIAATDNRVEGVASDAPLEGLSIPVFDLNDTDNIADFILDYVGLNERAGKVSLV
ncbi:molybdopterin-guanine dinucleotide biosynthesis protein B [Primorskyibacter aestuariivivens]|uniref:molybdopterin-guanine dinucleotide biosynthesis protein B n=1 Tax=Primorskyibacter aestuariivivens TaxID=1888912 RepID=UPI002300EC9B|nr:molybdopterin-guanine dinucleotide biosynthesis protein B [Primorskyibacter aestuariivivens]MDA7429885.1 molybdopterin-guanine dinucleotide biosynthesis protein B [Primorskyibacter aestuariivivens]